MKAIPCAALAFAFGLSAAAAEDCSKLISYGTIALTQIPGDSREYIPVEIAGVPRLMLLDTGSERTTITYAAAKELQLSTRWTDTPFFDLNAGMANHFVEAPLTLGRLKGDDVTFWMYTSAEPYHFSDPRIAGVLGYDILRSFDVAIDFGAHTLTLLDPRHCAGAVVYWPERPVVALPFRFKKVTLHVHSPIPPMDRILFVFPSDLDGQTISALPVSGIEVSQMEQRRAAGKYDLELGTPDTPLKDENAARANLFGYEVGSVDISAMPGLSNKIVPATAEPAAVEPPPPPPPKKSKRKSTFVHRFKTLAFGGITVNDPKIDVIPDVELHKYLKWTTGTLLDLQAHAEEQHESLIRVGMNVLKHLRLYIAYKEKTVYVSPASNEAVNTLPDQAPKAPN